MDYSYQQHIQEHCSFRLSNGYIHFSPYHAEAVADNHNDNPILEEQLICQPTGIVSDDKDRTGTNDDNLEDENNWPDELNKAPHGFNFDGPTTLVSELLNIIVDEEE